MGDTGGSVALSAQDPTPLIAEGKPNPYNTLLPKPYDALDGIPWSQLQAVSPAYRPTLNRALLSLGGRVG